MGINSNYIFSNQVEPEYGLPLRLDDKLHPHTYPIVEGISELDRAGLKPWELTINNHSIKLCRSHADAAEMILPLSNLLWKK